MKNMLKFTDYLEFQKASYLNKSIDLKREDRQDEADLAKIWANIFDIFLSITNAAKKQCADNANDFIRNYIEKLTAEWQKSLTEAEKHNDYIKATQEQAKLSAVSQIKTEFMRLEDSI